MTLKFIKEQSRWVDSWTTNLTSSLEESECGIVEGLDTSINWQLGHMISSKYFHCIQSVLDKNSEIISDICEKMPIPDFFRYYFAGSNPLDFWEDRPSIQELLEYKNIIDLTVHQVLDSLNEKSLAEETEINNPIAKTKFDALAFSFKHQMYHNGQIAMIQRIIR